MLCVLMVLCWSWGVLGYGGQKDSSAAGLCPSPCQCEEDGIFVLADCSELGLSAVPDNLSHLTTYLDLSMNSISELQPRVFHSLHLLTELRISGNRLRYISGLALHGLHNLKVLMLQNNQLERLPNDIPWNLPNLLSLRLDANLLSEVPARSLGGLRSLRHLWLDDNSLTEIPVSALDSLPALQAMTLALNHITHIPDHAFSNLSSLVVLHLHNNQIQTMGERCFQGLLSLETLDLNYNDLLEFPTAIRTLAKLQELGFHHNNIRAIPERAFMGNRQLQTIHFYENPIQSVGRSAFQFLPKLHTLSLNGATQIRDFPDLKGTTSLETLTLTRAGLSTLPQRLCQQLLRLRVLELSHNQIEDLPSFYHCSALQEIGLQYNHIRRIERNTFQQLSSLQSLDLSFNSIEWIHPDAFISFHSLTKLDLSENSLTSLPVGGLGGLTHLKLKGNMELYEDFSPELFTRMRVVEMPYAYQCCVYGSCDSYKPISQPETEQSSEEEELDQRAVALYPIHTDTLYDPDLEDLQMEIQESKLQTNIQCSPVPGPFRPCDSLLGSWLVRVGLWCVSIVSLLGNSLLLLSLFGSAGYLSPLRFTTACMAAANLLTGVCTCTLALVDALTLGEFGRHGARWESGPGCQVTGWVWVFASEASVLLLTLAAVQCGMSVTCARAYGKAPSHGSVRTCAFFCLTLSLTLASLPLLNVGEYGSTPLCLPSPASPLLPSPSSLGFPLSLIMMNTLCLLIVTVSYIRLYWELLRGECEGLWDCSMIKHITWLIFINGLLYIPVAFLSLCSLLGLLSLGEEVLKSVLLLLQPLPSCLNPLLFLLFTRDHTHFLFWPHPKARPQLYRDRTLEDSLVSVDTEKSLCSDLSTQVSLAEADALYGGSPALQPRMDPIRLSHCFSSSSSSVPLIPCQTPSPSLREREMESERERERDMESEREAEW
ncbi:LOW QUALITY PROTEIN: leucine-rich repeat-containing G-protein coupled receptor 6 [Oncorhynchus masou masou]|uniref:LOW QUALITY PROTEIN: leucine-rich repeat-containing G-protein coupled receptor 6 n=1 Tax=Oncorhynchus masou masou TaxID=90313 RepID=UPI003183190B